MSFTYATLKSTLQDYTQNDETSFVSNLPTFIRLAEERILKSVQLNIFQKNVSGNMTSGNQYLAAPSIIFIDQRALPQVQAQEQLG